MCLSCGCHERYESHGNAANITMADLAAAAEAAGISPAEAAENILNDVERDTDVGATTIGVDVSEGVQLADGAR